MHGYGDVLAWQRAFDEYCLTVASGNPASFLVERMNDQGRGRYIADFHHLRGDRTTTTRTPPVWAAPLRDVSSAKEIPANAAPGSG